jgi:hypothetical protein
MPERWRNRVFAPLYALVITFVLVFLTGAALPEPAQAPLPEPAQASPRLTVTVQANREQPDQKVPGAPEKKVPGPATQVCMSPPKGWAVDDPAPDPTGSVCVDARGEPVPIVLRKLP